MSDFLFRVVWRAVVATALIATATAAWACPSRPTDPDAVRMQSGNTVLFDHSSECWVGNAPAWAPEVPGHVIMRVEGGTREGHWFYGGSNYVGIALNDIFTHDNPRVFVVAFCK